MKKYLLGLLLCPLFALAQQTEVVKPTLYLGLSINSTTTTAAAASKYNNTQNSTYLFPEAHIAGDLNVFKNSPLLLRLEGGLTFIQNKYNLTGTNGYTAYTDAYKVNQVVATFTPQLLYRFKGNTNKRFYSGVGLSLSGISGGVHINQMSLVQGASYYLSGQQYESKGWMRMGGNLKAGMLAGKFDVYVDYNKAFVVQGPMFTFGTFNPDQTEHQYIFKIGVNYRID